MIGNIPPAIPSKLESLASAPTWLRTVRRQVESIRYGQVQIVVNDAQVVQIERIEKVRVEPGQSRQPQRS